MVYQAKHTTLYIKDKNIKKLLVYDRMDYFPRGLMKLRL